MRNLIRYQELGDYSQTDLAGFFAKNFFFFFANLLTFFKLSLVFNNESDGYQRQN